MSPLRRILIEETSLTPLSRLIDRCEARIRDQFAQDFTVAMNEAHCGDPTLADERLCGALRRLWDRLFPQSAPRIPTRFEAGRLFFEFECESVPGPQQSCARLEIEVEVRETGWTLEAIRNADSADSLVNWRPSQPSTRRASSCESTLSSQICAQEASYDRLARVFLS